MMGTLKKVVLSALVFGAGLAMTDGLAGPGSTGPALFQPQCCNPLEEPGQFGNPVCIEGASCCASGAWQCNNASGQSTCVVAGTVCETCCDPFAEPGQHGNPACFEGATCCATGEWQCNDASAHSTCALDGIVCDDCCDPAEEPGQGGSPPCFEGASCCSDGTWQCNDAGANSTCPLDGAVCEEEICGGFAGIPCDDPQDFCKLNVGECCCDFQGVCTPIPEACPDNYDPVCGCDGVTYSNECFADAAGVSIDHVGPCGQICGGITGIPCDDGEFCLLPPGGCCCDFQGVCVDIPNQCPAVCDPVCGCDGRTYRNRCLAIKAGTSIDHDGPCHSGGGLISGVGFESKPKMRWQPQSTALSYNVYRALFDPGQPFNAGVCFATGLQHPTVPVSGDPQPDELWLFQVSGQYTYGEGPLGIGWTCVPLEPVEPCSSSDEALCEETGGTWDPNSCGHYPCGQFPPCDAIIPGCNCGIGSNFVEGQGCAPDPDCGP